MRTTPLILLILSLLAGCSASSDQSDQTTIEQRQEKALADPMHYSVDMSNTDIDKGGLGAYDDKAMKRDLDATFGP